MKKLVKILVIAVIAVFVLSSCNKYVCPAYADTNKDNAEQES